MHALAALQAPFPTARLAALHGHAIASLPRCMLPANLSCCPPPCSLASELEAAGEYARASGSLQVLREQLEDVLKARKEDKARCDLGGAASCSVWAHLLVNSPMQCLPTVVGSQNRPDGGRSQGLAAMFLPAHHTTPHPHTAPTPHCPLRITPAAWLPPKRRSRAARTEPPPFPRCAEHARCWCMRHVPLPAGLTWQWMARLIADLHASLLRRCLWLRPMWRCAQRVCSQAWPPVPPSCRGWRAPRAACPWLGSR